MPERYHSLTTLEAPERRELYWESRATTAREGNISMTHLHRTLGLLSLLLLATAIPTPVAALHVGDAFPSMTLTDTDGRTHDLSSKTGYVVVIYFMGFSCTPCVGIADDLEGDFVTPYRDDRVDVFAVDSWDGLPEELTRLRDEAGVRYPFLLNGGGLLEACDLEWHSFVILDGTGVVRYVNQIASSGSYQPSEMQTIVDEYLLESVETEIVTWGEIKRFYDPNRRDSFRPVANLP